MRIILLLFVMALLTFCSSEQIKNNDNIEADKSIIHEGEIDLAAIDKDADGNLWECPMDWNVIDDKSGDCPSCGMKLKEYTLEQTKENLNKHGYAVK